MGDVSPRAVGPLADAARAINKRLDDLQHQQAKRGQPPLASTSPDELAGRVRCIADMARVEAEPSTVTWATIGALALAGWVSAARSEGLRVDTGDAA